MPTRWCGRAVRRWPSIAFATRRDPPRPSASDRHGHHAVRAGGPVEGPTGHRVHAAGVVGRDRGPRPRIGGPGTGIRRRAGRRLPRRRVRERGDDWPHGCAGAAELIDLSMLEAQILGLTYYPVTYYEMLGRPWRDARRLTVPGIARAKRRPDRHRLRNGAAVVRPVRDDRTSGLDRRGVAAVDHRAGQREVRRTLRVGREPNRSTRSAISRRRSAFPTPRSPTAPTSNRSTTSRRAGRSSRIRATASRSPGRRYRIAAGAASRTAAGTAPRRTHRAATAERTIRPQPRRCLQFRQRRSTGCASST